MKKQKQPRNSRRTIFAAFLLAVVLLIVGTVGSALAKPLQELPNEYVLDLKVDPTVKLTIVESVDGTEVSTGNGLLQALESAPDKVLKPGLRYDEELAVRNDGIPAYVRVIVHKFWSDEDGTKRPDLDSSLIKLTLGGSDWKTIEESASGERTILYYNGVMAPGAVASFADGLVIDGRIIKLVTQTEEPDGTINTVYIYDGKYITIQVEADGVQTHNAQDAIRSAWGVDPSVAGA